MKTRTKLHPELAEGGRESLICFNFFESRVGVFWGVLGRQIHIPHTHTCVCTGVCVHTHSCSPWDPGCNATHPTQGELVAILVVLHDFLLKSCTLADKYFWILDLFCDEEVSVLQCYISHLLVIYL